MKEKLLKSGLNSTEIEVYLHVLSHGKTSPSSISKATGIKRPTVYAAAAELVRRGLITEDLGNSSKYLIAKADDIKTIILDEQKKLLEQESLVKSLIPDLKEIARTAEENIPKIQYVREADLKDFFYKQNPVWNESMIETRETSWWGYNSKDLTENKFVQDWIEHSWKTTPKQIELHLFSNEHPGEKILQQKNHERRHIKYWNDEYGASQWVLGDYVVLVVTNQKPQYAIQIKDRLIAESLRRTYRKLWNLMD